MRTWKWIFFDILVVIVVGLGLSNIGKAGPLEPDQAALIYGLAHSVSHLPLPDRPPEIHITSAAKIDKMLTEMGVCPRGCPNVKGAQVGNRVYVDENLDFGNVQNAAILFHEFVHYLQWAKDGEAKTCEEWRDREITAYHLQNLVLHKAGAMLVQAPPMPSCPDDSKKKQPLPERVTPLEGKVREDTFGRPLSFYTSA